MPHFYFDHRDGGDLLRDYDGLELADVDQARKQATWGLVGFAKDAIRDPVARDLAIEVSDADHNPLFRTALSFRVDELAPKRPPAFKWR